MKIAVLGTGMVGVTIANKLLQVGHEVRMVNPSLVPAITTSSSAATTRAPKPA
jgi:3-hydroxyisobutyrate dehydrogenase-like beta-hydroxyacid dehydrogenase